MDFTFIKKFTHKNFTRKSKKKLGRFSKKKVKGKLGLGRNLGTAYNASKFDVAN